MLLSLPRNSLILILPGLILPGLILPGLILPGRPLGLRQAQDEGAPVGR